MKMQPELCPSKASSPDSHQANVAAAMHLLQTAYKGKTTVVLICDSGLK